MTYETRAVSGTFEVDVTTDGEVSDVAGYARAKVKALARFAHGPVLFARVRVTRHRDPAVQRPVVAQANLELRGRPIRAQACGETPREAIDLLTARLRDRLQRSGEKAARRHRVTPRPWSNPTPPEGRRVVRRKSFSPAPCSIDDAVLEMDMLDYDFHLFIEESTGIAGVVYRSGPTGIRLAQVVPPDSREWPSVCDHPVTVSDQPAPCLLMEEAIERLGLLGLPFLFFIDAAQGRANVLYKRYDGNCGLITLSG